MVESNFRKLASPLGGYADATTESGELVADVFPECETGVGELPDTINTVYAIGLCYDVLKVDCTLKKEEKGNYPGQSISCKMVCAPSEDSDQPAHPRSLIRVLAGHLNVSNQGSKSSERVKIVDICYDTITLTYLCNIHSHVCLYYIVKTSIMFILNKVV